MNLKHSFSLLPFSVAKDLRHSFSLLPFSLADNLQNSYSLLPFCFFFWLLVSLAADCEHTGF